MTRPEIFLRGPLAPMYFNTGGGAPAEEKKTQFSCLKFCKRCIKTLFRPVFLKKLPAAQKVWSI